MTMEWGKPIEVNGVRPEWLRDEEPFRWGPDTMWASGDLHTNARGFNWDRLDAIRLPANHWYYRVTAWNEAHPSEQPFKPWGGGDSAPADWDNGMVLYRDGLTGLVASGMIGRWAHPHTCASQCPDYDIIGYHPRTEPTTQSDTVTIARMSEAEAVAYANKAAFDGLGHAASGAHAALKMLGIIRLEPTEAEEIAATTGLSVADVQRVLDARDA